MTFLMTPFASAGSNAAVSITSTSDSIVVRMDVFVLVAVVLTVGIALFQFLLAVGEAKRARVRDERRGCGRRAALRRRAVFANRLAVCGAWQTLFLVAIVVVATHRPENRAAKTATVARISTNWFGAKTRANSDANVAENAPTGAATSIVREVALTGGDDVAFRAASTSESESASPLDAYPTGEPVFIPFVRTERAIETPASASATNDRSGASRASARVARPLYVERADAGASRVDVLRANFAPTAPIVPYPNLRPESNVRFVPNARAERSAAVEQASYAERAPSEFPDSPSLLVQLDEEFNRISDRVRSSVLPIETRRVANNATKKIEEETGCGFLLQYDGRLFVVTNRHVVAGAASLESIKIFLPSRKSVAPIKALTCPDFDLAVLELNPSELPKDGSVSLCHFGDSDELRVANFVGTIGNPFGLRDTVTYGHVSSLRRRNLPLGKTSKNSLQEYVQIDAAINPGNSGGPLYNARGEVVGVVTAIATTTGKNEGVAFAIPINLALNVVKSTIDGGGWRRSHMGVELAPATREDVAALAAPGAFGSKIVCVQTNSPAEKAGLRQGDVVLAFNGEPVEDDVHLARLIALSDARETQTLRVLRDGRAFELKAGLVRGKPAE